MNTTNLPFTSYLWYKSAQQSPVRHVNSQNIEKPRDSN